MKKLFAVLFLLLSLTMSACSSFSEAFNLEEYWADPIIVSTQDDSSNTVAEE